MEEFSLEKYLANPERKLVTRDGMSVRIICTDRKKSELSIVALEQNGEGEENLMLYTANGETFLGQRGMCDLFFAPIKHEGWVNIYLSGKVCGEGIYATEEEAKKNAAADYMATAKIEWED